jgi:hypothetical protein
MMITTPTRHGTEPEVDDETRATLDERLKTIERDAKTSEEWTPDLRDRRIQQLKNLALK